jgi:hypothetical protein
MADDSDVQSTVRLRVDDPDSARQLSEAERADTQAFLREVLQSACRIFRALLSMIIRPCLSAMMV